VLLAVAFLITARLNRILIARGREYAVVNAYHYMSARSRPLEIHASASGPAREKGRSQESCAVPDLYAPGSSRERAGSSGLTSPRQPLEH
jgi:hypothetical protein